MLNVASCHKNKEEKKDCRRRRPSSRSSSGLRRYKTRKVDNQNDTNKRTEAEILRAQNKKKPFVGVVFSNRLSTVWRMVKITG